MTAKVWDSSCCFICDIQYASMQYVPKSSQNLGGTAFQHPMGSVPASVGCAHVLDQRADEGQDMSRSP